MVSIRPVTFIDSDASPRRDSPTRTTAPPQARFQMDFELRQTEIRAAAARGERRVVVKQIQTEVDERTGDLLAVEVDVLLVEMPAARPHEQRRDLRVQAILLAVGIRKL